MFASILAAIAAIPKLLGAIQQLIAYMDKMDRAGFFAENAKAQQDLLRAETPEEFKQAAKEVNDTLKKL